MHGEGECKTKRWLFLQSNCEINTNIDGIENNEVKIQGLYGYIMRSVEAEIIWKGKMKTMKWMRMVIMG